MRERRHVLRPEVKRCESRALLSGGHGAAPAHALVATQPVERVIHLDGTFRGHYQEHEGIPDTGNGFTLMGSGHAHGFGRAYLTGGLHAIGFVAIGHSQGMLYLAGVRGALALKLTGPEQHNGPKGLPDVYSFQTDGGTGAYRNVVDTGTAVVVTIPRHSKTPTNDLPHGNFVVVLTSNPNPTM